MAQIQISIHTASGEKDNPVYKALLYSNFVIVVIGFVIYFSPNLAANVNMDSIVTAGINQNGVGYRFGSYMGSLELGSICAISIPLLLMHDFKHKLVKPVFLIVFSVAILLTMQRGAWIVGALSVLACMIISAVVDRQGLKSIVIYSLFGIIVMLALIYFVDHFMSAGVLKHLQIRLERFNFDSMIGSSSRANQIENGFKVFLEYPFGFGLGAAGNKASPYHMQIVPDGNWLRILVESGIIGMISFIALNFKAIKNGLHRKNYYSTLIIILFLAHSIGSNVLDFYYGSFIYWYILGYLNRPELHGMMECCNSGEI